MPDTLDRSVSQQNKAQGSRLCLDPCPLLAVDTQTRGARCSYTVKQLVRASVNQIQICFIYFTNHSQSRIVKWTIVAFLTLVAVKRSPLTLVYLWGNRPGLKDKCSLFNLCLLSPLRYNTSSPSVTAPHSLPLFISLFFLLLFLRS